MLHINWENVILHMWFYYIKHFTLLEYIANYHLPGRICRFHFLYFIFSNNYYQV